MNTRTPVRFLLALGLLIAAAMSAALAAGFTFKGGAGSPEIEAPTSFTADTAAEPHPLLSDVRIRRAVAYCTDRAALVDSVYPLLTTAEKSALLMDSFLPKEHWAYSPPPPGYDYPFDPAQGAQLLEDAGWTLQPGATYRTNAAGYELAFSLTTTQAVFRTTWTSILEEQLRGNCGIRLVRLPIPSSVLFGDETGLARRDFETAVYAWVGSSAPPQINLYGCDYIPSPDNGWSGMNYMGWCNLTADQALQEIGRSRTHSELLAQSAIVQNEFAKDMVSLPVFHRTATYVTDSRLVPFSLGASEPYYLWNVYLWSIPGENTIKIGSSQEPASLWPLVENSYIANLVASAVYGQPATRFNYDLQAQLYTAIPTVENGGIITQTVQVSQGDTVLDPDGEVVNLQPGVQVIDAQGQLVTYASGTLDMLQIAYTTHYIAGMSWPDGSELSQQDLRLWDEVSCDASIPPVSMYYCERTAGRTYLGDTGVRYTMIPGYVNIFNPLMPGAYPANRLLSDGRLLKDVPYSEWSSLPEIMERPVGLGPYYVEAWQYGEYIRLARNPYYALGQPATLNMEFVFADPGSLEQWLITRTIHVLDPTTLAGINESLKQAIDAGVLTGYIVPSGTWEHLDFNLDLYSLLTALPLDSAGGVLTSTLGMTVTVPADAFAQDVTLLLNNTYLPVQPLPGSIPLLSFSLQALDPSGTPITSLAEPLTLTVVYTDEQLADAGVQEADLNLAYWDGNGWQPLLPCAGCSHDLDSNTITAVLTHLSDFSLAATKRMYLPIIQR